MFWRLHDEKRRMKCLPRVVFRMYHRFSVVTSNCVDEHRRDDRGDCIPGIRSRQPLVSCTCVCFLLVKAELVSRSLLSCVHMLSIVMSTKSGMHIL